MRLLEAFEDPALARALAARIAEAAKQREQYVLMEVCGTHTHAIGKWGLRSMMPEKVRLVSGPGCPVCVTPGEYIDNACRLARGRGAVIATFGDLMRVPGMTTSLDRARAEGADVRVLYSPMDAVALARAVEKEVVFLAIGFETTIVANAVTMRAALNEGLKNLSFYLSLRTVPPALDALIADPETAIDGFILPGHVSVIIGPGPYREVLGRHGVPGVICGFEPVQMLQGIAALIETINRQRESCVAQALQPVAAQPGEAAPYLVQNLYPQVVREEGNPAARRLIATLFEPCDAVWRGIGTIPESGLRLRPEYALFDAEKRFSLPPMSARTTPGCRCGQVMRGVIQPEECPLFGGECTPSGPVGPCMVSAEGSCSAHYTYGPGR